MIDFLVSHPEKIITPLLGHISLTAETLVISVLLASVLTILAAAVPILGSILTAAF